MSIDIFLFVFWQQGKARS